MHTQELPKIAQSTDVFSNNKQPSSFNSDIRNVLRSLNCIKFILIKTKNHCLEIRITGWELSFAFHYKKKRCKNIMVTGINK